MKEVVYTPDSPLKKPLKLLKAIRDGFWEGRELAWRLFLRDTASQYRQSLLGIFWAFLPPIITGTVFIFLESQGVLRLGETDVPYPAYVLIGTTLWQLFTESLYAPLKILIKAKSMLSKVHFPWEALILESLFQALFGCFIKSLLIIGVFLFFGLPFTGVTLFFPIGVLALIMLGICIGLILTPLGMIYNDVLETLKVILPFWFFLTPVVYTPSENFVLRLISPLNPVTPVLMTARDLIARGTWNDPVSFASVTLATIAFFFIGLVMYRVSMPILIERMSA